METIKAVIDLPGTFHLLIKKDRADITSFIKQTVAIELYRERKISLGKAAELAGVRNKWEMMIILSQHDVPIQYTAQDAKSDLKSIKQFLGK